MNLYQTRHPFYCGIDLHANQMYACVVDQDGRKHLHRNFKTRQSDKFFAAIEPFGKELVVGFESTFNWYWLSESVKPETSRSCSATLCTSKRFTVPKSKMTKSTPRNLRCCYEAVRSRPLTPIPPSSEQPEISCAGELTSFGSKHKP